MAITFTNWTTSDDPYNPVIGWSFAEVQGFPRYIHAEALRQAVVERSLFTGVNIHAVLSNEITATSSNALQKFMMEKIDQYIIGAFLQFPIPGNRFVNYFDSNGDWSGKTLGPFDTLIPEWTMATIIANIGDPARLTIGAMASAAWVVQTYEILNRFRWTKELFALPKHAFSRFDSTPPPAVYSIFTAGASSLLSCDIDWYLEYKNSPPVSVLAEQSIGVDLSQPAALLGTIPAPGLDRGISHVYRLNVTNGFKFIA